jgi:hypothetical protein
MYTTSKHYKEENLLSSNKYISECEFVPEHPFEQDFVCQVAASISSMIFVIVLI